MTESNVEDTLPVAVDGGSAPAASRSRRLPWILLGIAFLLVGLAIGIFSGYSSGMAMRLEAESGQLQETTAHQYQLALMDQQNGKIANAITRMEYVLQLDPNFPNGKQFLTELEIARQLTSTPATPTPAPSPTPSPTPDLRSAEELYEQARQYLAAGQWNDAILTIDQLRTTNIEFRPVDVDGLYYTALTRRGMDKILLEGALESGIYDLTLAEKIGPLDQDASNYRRWARLYLSAASYWDADWARVVSMFGDIYPALPALRDSSGMTATERYRIGLGKYGESLAAKEMWCEAEQQFMLALEFGPDALIQPKLDEATQKCHSPEEEQQGEETAPPPADTTTTTPAVTPDVTVSPEGQTTVTPDGQQPTVEGTPAAQTPSPDTSTTEIPPDQT